MAKYEIYDLSDLLSSGAVEYLGSREKGWITLEKEDLRILVKIGRSGTGENWAEKVACELAELLSLPHAIYNFALADGEPCVISPSFLKEGEELRLGNQLIEGYDNDSKFKNQTHTLTGIMSALERIFHFPFDIFEPDRASLAERTFIGYLCFDAWIGNTDRHAENWGIITKMSSSNMPVNVLAPTFDHASSLGRNESDENRIKRLKAYDKGYSVEAYAKRADTPIYDQFGKKLSTLSLVKECKEMFPKITHHWIEKIGNIMKLEKNIEKVFNRVPDNFITAPAKEFAMEILKENYKNLRRLINE